MRQGVRLLYKKHKKAPGKNPELFVRKRPFLTQFQRQFVNLSDFRQR